MLRMKEALEFCCHRGLYEGNKTRFIEKIITLLSVPDLIFLLSFFMSTRFIFSK